MTTVATSRGTVRGRIESGIHEFKGIPYAAPPIGDLRWCSPQQHNGWSGVLEALSYSAASWQPINEAGGLLEFDQGSLDRSEDCLTLNIWTPNPDSQKRPVLFWIHGGGFINGTGASALYDGSPLASRGDVVVVTINYRLGPYGFLNLNEVTEGRIASTGNEGIEDQVFALKWVQENIERFGGDPQNVTIFGESAGGMSVGTLLAYPSAKGLFHRAIPQSGACHTANTLGRSTEIAEKLLSHLEVDPSDVDSIRSSEPETVLKAVQELSVKEPGLGMIFQPCIDGSQLPDLPIRSVEKGSADDFDVMVGATRDEWRLFVDPRHLAESMSESQLKESLADASFMIEPYRELLNQLGHEPTPAAINSAIQTDRAFRIPAIRLAEALGERGSSTYQYLFTVESPAFQGAFKACHAIDIGYVFGTLNANENMGRFFGSSPEHLELSNTTMDVWLEFARSGDPTSVIERWQPYTKETRSTAIFGLPASAENDPYGNTRSLWNELDLNSGLGTL